MVDLADFPVGAFLLHLKKISRLTDQEESAVKHDQRGICIAVLRLLTGLCKTLLAVAGTRSWVSFHALRM